MKRTSQDRSLTNEDRSGLTITLNGGEDFNFVANRLNEGSSDEHGRELFALEGASTFSTCFKGEALAAKAISANDSIDAIELHLIRSAIQDGPCKQHESSTGAKRWHSLGNALPKWVEKFTRFQQETDRR
jgi:hypothetical protein